MDLAQLSDSQREALQTYTSVTAQDPAAAIPLLQRSEWNVQIAIAKFFDGEAPDPLEEARRVQAAGPPPRLQGQREVLLEGLHRSSRSSASSDRQPAPRIVPQPENRGILKPPLLFAILLTPFNVLYRLLSGTFSIFSHFIPFLPRLLANISRSTGLGGNRRNTSGRRALSARDTAARFVREFEEVYGNHTLPFFQDGYAQAYDLAKKELKYLLVVLLSPEHDDTSTFVHETLLSQEFTIFVNNTSNNIILWAGSVQDSEAYQVSTALNCTKFPFAALVVHTAQDSSTSMSTVARITGLMPTATFITKLEAAKAQHSQALDRIRATRAEQEASRNIRQEQNSAYERSLAQDRERMRLRREAEAAKLRAEQEEKARLEAEEQKTKKMEQWKQWKAQQIAPEAGADVKDAIKISIRMPSGERVIRKFRPQSTVEDLYAFVECHDSVASGVVSSPPSGYQHEYKFRIVSPMPRAVYELGSGSLSATVGRSANLIMEPITEDEDDEE